MLCHSALCISEHSSDWLVSRFSTGAFKSLGTNPAQKKAKQVAQTLPPDQANADSEESPSVPSVFSCPQDGCVKVFQRLSSLEKHLSLEKCTQALEKRTLLDLAKLGYKSLFRGRRGMHRFLCSCCYERGYIWRPIHSRRLGPEVRQKSVPF